MESFAQSTNMKRFVIQDTYTKVTMDGEPHEMMIMIAGCSGILAAIIILAILVSLVGCNNKNKQDVPASPSIYLSADGTGRINSNRSSVQSILRRDSSVIEDTLHNVKNFTTDSLGPMSVTCISSGNLEGNLNSAFQGSELQLNDSSLSKKNSQMIKANEIICNVAKVTANDTIINIEKY